jgi:hypothetical protein
MLSIRHHARCSHAVPDPGSYIIKDDFHLIGKNSVHRKLIKVYRNQEERGRMRLERKMG